MIIAKRGDGYSGDIAIDNLDINGGQCLGEKGSADITPTNTSPSSLHRGGSGFMTYTTLSVLLFILINFV